MITLTAKIHINATNPRPFKIGQSVIGGGDLIGENINIEKDFTQSNLISISRSIFSRSDTKSPSYGILSNNGLLEFNDTDQAFLHYASAGLLVSGLKVYIYLNNTLTKKSEMVGVFETNTWNYDNNNRSVSVSLKDDLEDWQEIQNDGINYNRLKPYEIIEEGRMSSLYRWLQKKTPQKYNMLSYDQLDEITKSILYDTQIKYPLLKSGTLWQQWEKLCQVCGLYIYKNNEGNTVCTYTYGS